MVKKIIQREKITRSWCSCLSKVYSYWAELFPGFGCIECSSFALDFEQQRHPHIQVVSNSHADVVNAQIPQRLEVEPRLCVALNGRHYLLNGLVCLHDVNVSVGHTV